MQGANPCPHHDCFKADMVTCMKESENAFVVRVTITVLIIVLCHFAGRIF